MRKSIWKSLLLLGIVLSICGRHRVTRAQSLLGSWQFEATATEPSASMEGFVDVLFDSSSYLVGAVRVDAKIEKFHGRHFGSRILLRTDTTMKPVMRLDATLDSTGTGYSGNLQVQGIEAKEAHKKAKIYDNVIFAFFASKSSPKLMHARKARKKH